MTQYAPLGEVAAPADWVIPPSLEIVPVAIYAGFDGSTGAAEFVPCLDIISDSGHTVGRYVASETVAANSWAEVSWAPFLRGGAGAAAGTPSLAYAIGYSSLTDAEQAVATGANVAVVYNSFETSDASLFTLAGGGLGITTHANMLLQAFVAYQFDYALTPAAQYLSDPDQLLFTVGYSDATPYNPFSGWVCGTFGVGPAGGPAFAMFGGSAIRTGKADAGLVSPAVKNNSGFATSLKLSERLLILTCLALT